MLHKHKCTYNTPRIQEYVKGRGLNMDLDFPDPRKGLSHHRLCTPMAEILYSVKLVLKNQRDRNNRF